MKFNVKSFEKSQFYIGNTRLEIVTEEYEMLKKPGVGSISYEPRTNEADRETGNWYFGKYGGEIKILEERFKENEKNPDAIIDGKFAEFKVPHTITGISNRLRKANKQILAAQGRSNTVGKKSVIIVDISYIDEDEMLIINTLAECFSKRIRCESDLIVRKGDEAVIIFRK